MKEINLSDPQDQKIFMLLQAESGKGKSDFALRAMQHFKTLYLNIDNKMAVANKIAKESPLKGKMFTDVASSDLINVLKEAQSKNTFELMVIDTISRLQSEDELNTIETRGQCKAGPDEMRIKDRGKVFIHMLQIMKLIPKDKMHVLCLTHCEKEEIRINDETVKTTYKPMLSGKFKQMLGGWFNIVAHLDYYHTYPDGQKQTVRRMYFTPGDGYEAKTEFDLPDSLDNPSFVEIVRLVNGGEDKTD